MSEAKSLHEACSRTPLSTPTLVPPAVQFCSVGRFLEMTNDSSPKASKTCPTAKDHLQLIDKPVSKQCAISCAKAGSPLVILAEDGTIYWPIADTTPSRGQNQKLLPFAGEKVTATGKVYDRGGSKAIVIEKIEPQNSKM